MIQLQVLNKILSTKDFGVILYNNITEEFFSEYTAEFRAIKAHQDTYGTVPDLETFLSSFPNFDVLNVSEPWGYLTSELTKDKNTRTLAQVFNKVRELINQGRTEEAFELYSTNSDLSVKAKKLSFIDLLHDTSRFDVYADKSKDFDKYFISTGFPELDKIIGGWDKTEELATIVARPNVGKSFILLKCATEAAKKGLRVGIYSGEMSANKMGFRMDSLISHISNTALNKGNLDVQNYYKKFIDELPTKYTGNLFVMTPQDIDGEVTVNALRAFIEKAELDILFVDQLTLLEDQHRARNPVERMANISKDLKKMQVLVGKPIVSVTQQNRADTEEKGISVANIGSSDRIGQDSTVVIFLEKSEDILSVHLIKSRDSANYQTLKYKVNFDRGEFMYVSDAAGQEAVAELAENNFDDLMTEGGEVIF